MILRFNKNDDILMKNGEIPWFSAHMSFDIIFLWHDETKKRYYEKRYAVLKGKITKMISF